MLLRVIYMYMGQVPEINPMVTTMMNALEVWISISEGVIQMPRKLRKVRKTDLTVVLIYTRHCESQER